MLIGTSETDGLGSVRMIETSDKVLGGANGTVNLQAADLVNRDIVLKNTLQSQIGSLFNVASLATNGYQKFPSGLIMQWGFVTTSVVYYVTESINVNFPITFQTPPLNIQVTTLEYSTSNPEATVLASCKNVSLSGFTITSREVIGGAQYVKYYWFAIGV